MNRYELRASNQHYRSIAHAIEDMLVIDNKTNSVVDVKEAAVTDENIDTRQAVVIPKKAPSP